MNEIDIKVDADLEMATHSNLLDEKDAILIQILREVQRLTDSKSQTAAKKNLHLVAKLVFGGRPKVSTIKY